MTSHPNRSRFRLAQCGARLRTIDGRKTVEMVDPNDRTGSAYQYRRTDDGGLESRRLRADGSSLHDGSPWEQWSTERLDSLRAQRGEYHPILDPLRL